MNYLHDARTDPINQTILLNLLPPSLSFFLSPSIPYHLLPPGGGKSYISISSQQKNIEEGRQS